MTLPEGRHRKFRPLVRVIAGGLLGLIVGLAVGVVAHQTIEANPDAYFSTFGGVQTGVPAGSVGIVIVTTHAGMVLGFCVGARWLVRAIAKPSGSPSQGM